MTTDGPHLKATDVSAEEGDSQTDFTDDSDTDPQPEVWADAAADEE